MSTYEAALYERLEAGLMDRWRWPGIRDLASPVIEGTSHDGMVEVTPHPTETGVRAVRNGDTGVVVVDIHKTAQDRLSVVHAVAAPTLEAALNDPDASYRQFNVNNSNGKLYVAGNLGIHAIKSVLQPAPKAPLSEAELAAVPFRMPFEIG